MVRALTRDATGRYHYRAGPDRGRFAKAADIKAYVAIQAANGRAGAAHTNARKGRFAKAAQTIGSNPRANASTGQAVQRIGDWLEDVYDAEAEAQELPPFPEFYSD